jgi:ATP-dependent DNA ligase
MIALSPLCPDLVLAKPIEQAPLEVIAELEASGRLLIERKRNGHATAIAVSESSRDGIGIYSRSIQDNTSKFPHHVEALHALCIPRGTLLQAETVMADSGIERPGLITRFAGSRPERSIALQDELGIPSLAFFNVLMHKGELVAHWPYEDRLDLVRTLCAKNDHPAVEVVEVIDQSFEQAKHQSITSAWEGLVLYDAKAGTECRLDGKHDRPPRPYGCWKWKDYLEGDFVATGWVPSTSKRFKGLVRDVLISQRDPVTGELISWGKVGVGLSSEDRQLYADDSLYPMVFEVQFEARTPNNRLVSAHILRRRTDKSPEECFAPS